MMHVTFSTGSLSGYPLGTIFGIARSVGADGVELMLTPRLLRRNPETVVQIERESGMPVRSVHSVMRLSEVPAAEAARDIIQSARFAAHFSGCRALVVHTPRSHSLHTSDTRQWLQGLEAALRITEESPITIAVENSGRMSGRDVPSFFDHPDRLRWLAQEWGVGITFDTSHAASRQWDLPSSLEKLLPHVVNVHLSDYGARSYRLALANAFLRDHQLPGRGTLPLAELMRGLTVRGYSGLVTLELSPLALGAPRRRSIERSLRESIWFCRSAARSGRPSTQRSQNPNRP